MRKTEIDFLRGMAVIMVLFRHHYFADILKQVGWAGVDLFFVLSGFLVSGLLFNEYKKFGNVKPVLFLIRRGFKIYPLYYLLMSGTAIRVLYQRFWGSGEWTTDPIKYLAELTFTQNYFGYLWPHTWSLAVEEHFYFSLTLVIFLMIKRGLLEKRMLFGAFVLFTMVACLSLRILNANNLEEYTHLSHLFPTHLRYDSLLWGVFLSYLYHFRYEPFKAFFLGNRKWLLAFAFACIASLFFFKIEDFFMHTIGLSLLYLGFGTVLVIMILWDGSNRFMEKIMSKWLYLAVAKIGFYSYSIYLWHLMVLQYVLPWIRKMLGFEPHIRIEFVYYCILSIAIGILISKLVELPALAIRDKYFPRRAAAM